MNATKQSLQLQEENKESNSQSSINYKKIKGTPFTMMIEEEKVTLLLGNQICTEHPFKSEKECKMYVNKKPYDLIILITTTLINHFKKNKIIFAEKF